jgi:hypothetical protein
MASRWMAEAVWEKMSTKGEEYDSSASATSNPTPFRDSSTEQITAFDAWTYTTTKLDRHIQLFVTDLTAGEDVCLLHGVLRRFVLSREWETGG